MFESKNSSPHFIAAIVGFTLGTISAILLEIASGHQAALIGFLLIAITGFLLTRYLVEKFIHRKINLIYKFIYQTKASKYSQKT